MTKTQSDDDGFDRYSGASNPTVRMDTRYDDLLKKTVRYEGDNPSTRIYRGSGEADKTDEVASENLMTEPVVGWLVVTGGPGRGTSLNLSYGRNSIGRDVSERVALNFGDEQVSRIGHAILTYDPRSRKFYLQAGQGPNLTYIEGRDEPVLTPVALNGGEEITLGGTRMKFVPFCGPDFEWNIK